MPLPKGSADLDQSSLALLNLELETGEQMLWVGKPSFFRDRFLLLRIGGLVIAQIAIIVHCLVLFHRNVSHRHLIAFLFTIIGNAGTWMLFFGPQWFWPYNRDRDSLFALTDRRAIRMWPVHSVAYLDEHGEPVPIQRRLLGRLTIGRTTKETWNGSPRWTKPRIASFLDFFAIAQVDDVLRIACEAQRKELESQSNRPAA